MALRPVLEELLGADPPVAVRAYDGTEYGPIDAKATLVVRSPDALRRIVTCPGELGFARAIGWVVPDRWLLVRAEYFDAGAQQPFKTFRAERVERIDGIWTVRKYSMVNHRARHSTHAEVVAVHYHLSLPAQHFVPEALRPAKDR